MFKFFFFLSVFFAISSITYAQKFRLNVYMDEKINRPNSDTIYYDANRMLTWSDFQGVPDQNHFGGAVTASGYAYNAEMNRVGDEVSLDIRIYTFFNKKSSWKKSSINSDYHLLHEQHHFDITRISAQKFYNELKKATFTLSNYRRLMNSIFDTVFEEHTVRQKAYDTETRHSINVKEQLRWNEIIAAEIKKL